MGRGRGARHKGTYRQCKYKVKGGRDYQICRRKKIAKSGVEIVTGIENGAEAGVGVGGNEPAFTPVICVCCLTRVLKREYGICLILIL